MSLDSRLGDRARTYVEKKMRKEEKEGKYGMLGLTVLCRLVSNFWAQVILLP